MYPVGCCMFLINRRNKMVLFHPVHLQPWLRLLGPNISWVQTFAAAPEKKPGSTMDGYELTVNVRNKKNAVRQMKKLP